MTLDAEWVAALSKAVQALSDGSRHGAQADAVATLMPLAKPGTRLSIDVDASKAIGAPLVTVYPQNDAPDLFGALTPRQKQVAALIVRGLTNAEISKELCISVATVKDHVHAILRQVNLPSRSAVIAAWHASTSG